MVAGPFFPNRYPAGSNFGSLKRSPSTIMAQAMRAIFVGERDGRATSVNAMNLKNRFRYVETNRANFAHGRLPSCGCALTQSPYGTSMPQSGRRPQHHSRRLCDQRDESDLPPTRTCCNSSKGAG
jgi:hypothetical protein